jgi:spore coat protein A, manganese oxidase
MEFSRRDLLKVGLFSSAALMLPAERVARTELAVRNRIPQSELPKPFTVPFAKPEVLQPVARSADTDYYIVTQKQVSAQILPGRYTDVWGYNGLVPGPTIMNTQGRQAVVRQINALPDVHPALRYKVWTSTHLHGSCSLPQYDGYASDITRPGEYKDYHYPNIQDARTLWYHDHGVHITATNAQMGLAGQYILHDPTELALPIPHGQYDIPLILKDAMFEKSGQLVLDDNDHSGMFGDVILVNGRPWPVMEVEPRKYRFRILNACISRSFDLALSTGDEMTVIGTDGGLMPHPQKVSHLRHGMAERYEVVIDFSKYKPGTRVVLKNLQPPNNLEYDNTNVVMAFDVGTHVADTSNNEIPRDLNPNMSTMGLTDEDSVRTRKFLFERENGGWTINGKTWADVVDSDYEYVAANPGFEDVEIWELTNTSGGWFHPVHIHLVDFRILDRNGKAPHPWELGPKDVAYVGENETVRVIMRFEHQRGKYMMHCHNLVHEDHDMMTQFEVGSGGDHPIKADFPKNMPAGPLYVPAKQDDDSPRGDDSDDDSRSDDRSDDSRSTSQSSGGSPVPTVVPAATVAAKRRRKRSRRKSGSHRSDKRKSGSHESAKHKSAGQKHRKSGKDDAAGRHKPAKARKSPRNKSASRARGRQSRA